MIDIYYESFTGNVRRFIGKVGLPAVELSEAVTPAHPFVIVTYTINFGQVPVLTADWLARHSDKLIGVASSGNRVWGANYAKAADIISEQYGVPIIGKFELAGTAEDVRQFTERMRLLDSTHNA